MHPVGSYCAKRNLNYVDRLSKNTEISNFMKIRQLGAELLHAEGRMNGQTDRQVCQIQ